MTTEPSILDVIERFMTDNRDLPAPVRRDLHVAEPVWRFLLDRYMSLIPREASSRLMEMPVVIDDDLTGGQWQIREDGEIASSGDMAPAPEGMTVSYSKYSGWIAIDSTILAEFET